MQDYDAVIDQLVSDIDEAVHSVHVLVYIFADDATGARVATALGRAVERGVDVRVMLDPVGSGRWLRGTVGLMHANQVQLLLSLPLRFLSHRTRRDMRNHRKVIVIDDRIGYAGSQNIVDKDFRPGIVNRELVVRLTGPIVAALAAVVHRDWAIERGKGYESRMPSIEAGGSAVVQLLPSGPSYRLPGFETLLIWQLHQATTRVVIATPYFIPSESLIDAMRIAVARGVTVELLVSKAVDQRFVNWAQSSYYETVMDVGVRVNLFQKGLLHAKNVSIDRCFAIVGSSNVDIRSFRLNEEVSLLFYDTASIDQVIEIQDGYLAESDQIDIREWRRRSPVRRLVENFAQMTSSLL
ncbi:phospholipase D-like domain-containing protein [Sphingomonas faeni]|uniref:phospholipase D-like domain-containing protein n=1 Tax=Sphingomonas faeni TaxID=185950 RepID=UPI0027D922C4|nr:phospholipase D-like domain-containing protein [Sphingomonas faeni]